MSALKAYQVTDFVKKPNLTNGIFLFYGPDFGLVYENSKTLIASFKSNSKEEINISIFENDDIIASPDILAKEANIIPMFGGTPLIRIRNATKSILPIIKETLSENLNATIILEAGNLTPRDSLRSFLEKTPNARTLPCYSDNDQSLSALIRQSFNEANITIDQNAIATLQSLLGNDREITRRELEKLKLYAQENKSISSDEIITLCGDNSTLAIDKIVDYAGTGRVELLDKEIKQAFNSNLDPQKLLILSLMHFSMLRKLKAQMTLENKSASEILNTTYPKPHFSRKTAIEQQLRLWNDNKLAQACNRIYEAISQTRKSPTLTPSTTHRALIAIGVASAHY